MRLVLEASRFSMDLLTVDRLLEGRAPRVRVGASAADGSGRAF